MVICICLLILLSMLFLLTNNKSIYFLWFRVLVGAGIVLLSIISIFTNESSYSPDPWCNVWYIIATIYGVSLLSAEQEDVKWYTLREF